jgi:hypothetical protein
VSASYSVLVKPLVFYKVWEFTKTDGRGFFEDIALTTDGFYTILFPSIGPNIVLKFDQNGRILNTKEFYSVWDISVGSDGVYVAEYRMGGTFVLSKHSLDLSSTLWELTTTINGRDFMAVDVSGNDVYVAFAEGGNYFIKKYSSSGVLLWTISFPRGGNSSSCLVNCLVVNKDTGDIYLSIKENYTSGQGYQKVFRISPSGSILSSITFTDWAYVPIYPSGTSVYLVRKWRFLEVYDQNFNLIRSLDICSAHLSLCSSQYEYWIANIFVSGGKLYAQGGKSIFDSNLNWLRDSLVLFEFTLDLDLVYVKDVGVSYKNDYDYGNSFGVLGNSVYIVGEFWTNSNYYYPSALKYAR